MDSGCVVMLDGVACPRAVPDGATLPLCVTHHLEAYDWVARDVGVTDLLPTACLACGSPVGVRYPSGWVCATCEWRVGAIPDGDAVQPQVEVVYYLGLGERVKIGTSANPRRRIAALPHDEVLALERGGRALEQARHRQFAAHRINGGEWFTAHDELTAHIIEVRGGALDPWDPYRLWVGRELARGG